MLRRSAYLATVSLCAFISATLALAGEFNELRLFRDPKCPACGENAHPTDLPTYEEVCAVPSR